MNYYNLSSMGLEIEPKTPVSIGGRGYFKPLKKYDYQQYTMIPSKEIQKYAFLVMIYLQFHNESVHVLSYISEKRIETILQDSRLIWRIEVNFFFNTLRQNFSKKKIISRGEAQTVSKPLNNTYETCCWLCLGIRFFFQHEKREKTHFLLQISKQAGVAHWYLIC